MKNMLEKRLIERSLSIEEGRRDDYKKKEKTRRIYSRYKNMGQCPNP
jgi:hypothetical protein